MNIEKNNKNKIHYVVSLGSFCFTAQMIQDAGLRRFSGPFDWIFSTPEVIQHCISDNFSDFLQRENYINCDHPKRWKLPIFEKLYGNKIIINHHNISVDKDFYAITRAVDRFRYVLKSPEPKLFVHVISSGHIHSPEYKKLWELLKYNTNFARFLLIGLNTKKEKPQLNEIDTHEEHFRIVDFTPTSEVKEGICFSDPSDNIFLRQVFDTYQYDLASCNQCSNDSKTMKTNEKISSVTEISTSLKVSEKLSIDVLSNETFESRPDPDFLYGYVPPKQLDHFRNDQYIPPVRILTISNVRLIGPFFQVGVLLEAMGSFFNIPDIASNPTTESSQNCLREIETKLKDGIVSIRKIRGKAALIACNGHQIYGHWLIDFLPKLALLSYSGHDIENIKLLVPENMGKFGKNLLNVLGFSDDQFITYNPETEILDIDALIIPSTLRWGGRCVPFFATAIKWLNKRINKFSSLPETNFSSRIFISRSLGGKHARTLINEKKLIEIAENYGFQAVAPELLTLPEQIAMFRKATHIIGPYGSGLHGSIFSPQHVMVCGIHGDGAFDALQSGVGERLQQKTGYIFTETHNHGTDKEFLDIFSEFLKYNFSHL